MSERLSPKDLAAVAAWEANAKRGAADHLVPAEDDLVRKQRALQLEDDDASWARELRGESDKPQLNEKDAALRQAVLNVKPRENRSPAPLPKKEEQGLGEKILKAFRLKK